MQSFKFIILSAIITIGLGYPNPCYKILSIHDFNEGCGISKFPYLESLVTIEMMNVTDFSEQSYWMYLNRYDKKIYQYVLHPAFCSKLLGLSKSNVCNLNSYIINKAKQLHIDNKNYNENYNVLNSLFVDIIERYTFYRWVLV
jgi:hypothetical protein